MGVLLVDRASFPRWKVCGSCLNGRALAVLATAGLGDLVERHGAIPLTTLRLATGRRSSVVALPEGRALGREAFDTALVQAALAAGAAFLPSTRADLKGVGASSRMVLLRQGEQARAASARVVLAADGLGAGVRAGKAIEHSRIGAGVVVNEAPAFYHPGTIFMGCGAGGDAGLVRLEDNRLDLAAAFDPALLKRSGGPGARRLAFSMAWAGRRSPTWLKYPGAARLD